MRDAEGPYREAVFSALSGHVLDVSDQEVLISEVIPENRPMPYVELVEAEGVDARTKTADGMEITLTMHIWSQYEGSHEVNLIADQVMRVLTAPDFQVQGFSKRTHYLAGSKTFKDPTGKSWHRALEWHISLLERSE